MNDLLSVAIIGVPSVILLAWQYRRGNRKIIRTMDANKDLNQLSELDELPGPELHVVEPTETAPPPPNRRHFGGYVGRSLAVLSAALFAAALLVDGLDELPRTNPPAPSTGTSLDQAPASSVTQMSLAASSQPQDDVHVQPSTVPNMLVRTTVPPPTTATVTRTATPGAASTTEPTPPPLATVSTDVSVPPINVMSAPPTSTTTPAKRAGK